MKTYIRHIIAVLLAALFITAPIAVIAQGDAAPSAETATAVPAAEDLPAKALALLTTIATWYGAICVALNGLSIAVSAIVKKTPGTSDDEAVDKFYDSKIYKAVAWVFSWGDYIGELVSKLKK